MKPLNQPRMLWRLGTVTFIWIVIQLLMLPNALHQNAVVLTYSGYGLLALITLITLIDLYRVTTRQIGRCYLAIDLSTLVLVGVLLILF